MLFQNTIRDIPIAVRDSHARRLITGSATYSPNWEERMTMADKHNRYSINTNRIMKHWGASKIYYQSKRDIETFIGAQRLLYSNDRDVYFQNLCRAIRHKFETDNGSALHFTSVQHDFHRRRPKKLTLNPRCYQFAACTNTRGETVYIHAAYLMALQDVLREKIYEVFPDVYNAVQKYFFRYTYPAWYICHQGNEFLYRQKHGIPEVTSDTLPTFEQTQGNVTGSQRAGKTEKEMVDKWINRPPTG